MFSHPICTSTYLGNYRYSLLASLYPLWPILQPTTKGYFLKNLNSQLLLKSPEKIPIAFMSESELLAMACCPSFLRSDLTSALSHRQPHVLIISPYVLFVSMLNLLKLPAFPFYLSLRVLFPLHGLFWPLHTHSSRLSPRIILFGNCWFWLFRTCSTHFFSHPTPNHGMGLRPCPSQSTRVFCPSEQNYGQVTQA